MLDEYTFTSVKQIRAYGDSLRLQLLHFLIEKPMTGSQLARKLNLPRQKIHYHLNVLKDAGLIIVYKEGVVRGLRELYYRSIARSFFTPEKTSLGDAYPEFLDTAQELVPLTFLRQVELDIQSHLGREKQEIIYCLQEMNELTAEQIREVRRELSSLNKRILRYSKDNKENQLHPLQAMRFTVFHIPVPLGDDENNAEE